MNWKFWSKPKHTFKSNTVTINMQTPCMVLVKDGKITYQHSTATLETITPPPNDGVWQGDGSPPIGTYKWNKPRDTNGFMHITYAVAMPQDGVLVDIPNTHDFLIALKTAFQTMMWKAALIFDQVPYTGPDCADITVGLNDGSDPIFVQFPDALARTYFPGTKPQGQFTSLYNLKFAFDLKNVNFHYDINEILRHELRHGIGDVHTTNPTDIMYPFYSARREPTAMDDYQDISNYGPRMPPVNPSIIANFYTGDLENIEFV